MEEVCHKPLRFAPEVIHIWLFQSLYASRILKVIRHDKKQDVKQKVLILLCLLI